MVSNLAPIILFVYNRPDHASRVLDALSLNPEAINSDLYIFCDGQKENASVEIIERINLTRKVVKSENRFGKKTIIERDSNFGLAQSIIDGVTAIVNQFDKVIVLEDDILPSIGFLKYMNEALEMYKSDENVGCIHAWNYTLNNSEYQESTFFLKGGDCWGWATWKRSWKYFNPNGSALLTSIRKSNIEYEFNRRDTQPFYVMLQEQIEGKNDSWAIRWYASLFIKNIYCLHPTKSIVENIGFDNSGTHCGYMEMNQTKTEYIELKKIDINESEWFFKAYIKALHRPFFVRVKTKGRRMMESIRLRFVRKV